MARGMKKPTRWSFKQVLDVIKTGLDIWKIIKLILALLTGAAAYIGASTGMEWAKQQASMIDNKITAISDRVGKIEAGKPVVKTIPKEKIVIREKAVESFSSKDINKRLTDLETFVHKAH